MDRSSGIDVSGTSPSEKDQTHMPESPLEHAVCSLEASHVLAWDEIANLTEETGKPAETLMNVVALIARRFRPMSARRICWSRIAPIWCWRRRWGCGRECIGTLRLALHEGLAGLVAEQVRPVAVEQVSKHPRFKYFSEAGEEAYQSFLGVPLIDRGVLQGVLVVQTVEARAFPSRRDPDADGGGGASGAGGQRSAHARTGSSRRRRSGCGRWRAICGGAGTTIRRQSVPRSGSGALAAAESQSRSRC